MKGIYMSTENQTLNDVIEIFESDSYEVSNKYLKVGWILLSTHLNDFGHPVERHQKTIYCLGWSLKSGEIAYPEKETNDYSDIMLN